MRDRLFEKLSCRDEVRGRAAIEMEHAALIQAPGVEAFARLHPRAFALGPAQLRLDRAHDGLSDLVLELENVGERAVIAACPDIVVACRFAELGGDADALACAPDASAQDV